MGDQYNGVRLAQTAHGGYQGDGHVRGSSSAEQGEGGGARHHRIMQMPPNSVAGHAVAHRLITPLAATLRAD